ncbi:TPA: type II toxin-antitoxin system HicB family antitoxin [Legionella pneumophila]
MNVLYPAQITFDKDDNRFLVQFPDIPEAITEGESEEEAFFNASEVLTLAIEGRLEEGMDVPQPSKCTEQQKLISPSVRAQAALLIRWAKLSGSHTTSEIARSLNTSWPAISRLEDPKHWPSLRQLEKVANALGQQLIISMEPLSKGH